MDENHLQDIHDSAQFGVEVTQMIMMMMICLMSQLMGMNIYFKSNYLWGVFFFSQISHIPNS
jgi:hypothetical protein